MNVHVPAFSPPSRDALAWLGTRPIPTKPFYDPVWYADEVETIFKRTWIQLGHVCELPRPDSFIVRNLEFAGLIFVPPARQPRLQSDRKGLRPPQGHIAQGRRAHGHGPVGPHRPTARHLPAR